MNHFHAEAEKVVDREAEQERQAKIARLQTDLEVKAQSAEHSRKIGEQRAASFAAEQKRVRENLKETFGEIAEQIALGGYHLLSIEGQRFAFLFGSRDRLEDAREVAERAGFGLDSYADHLSLLARDLAERFSGQILAVEPSDSEILAIKRELDERAKKAARA